MLSVNLRWSNSLVWDDAIIKPKLCAEIKTVHTCKDTTYNNDTSNLNVTHDISMQLGNRYLTVRNYSQ